MDTFEFNKMAGAVLFVLLVIVGIGTIGDMLVNPKSILEPAYRVVVPDAEEGAAVAAAPAAPEVVPIPVRLANANLETGVREARKCAACHTFDQGGANRVGPNLWDVVGNKTAHLDNFNYSNTLAQLGATWSYEALDEFIANPRAYLPGTSMAFAGIRNPQDRADLIAYMRSLSDDPKPLPEVVEVADEPAADATEEGAGEGAAPEAAPADDTQQPAQQQ